MDIEIQNVNIHYRDEIAESVDVHFQAGSDVLRIRGTVQLTPNEYEGNESVENLEAIVKQKMGLV